MTSAPLIVQADHTILLETGHPHYSAAREQLCRFAELVKSPEHVHFYRTTPLSLWNAAAVGVPIEEIVAWLVRSSRFPIGAQVLEDLRSWHARFGLLRFVAGARDDELAIESGDARALERLVAERLVTDVIGAVRVERGRVRFAAGKRGELKQALARLGYPVLDLAGYVAGAPLPLALRTTTRAGAPFVLREYQRRAAEAFWLSGRADGGCGVVVLPCGAGKTVTAIAAMSLLQTQTLVLTTHTIAVRQWREELLDKTALADADVGEYSGDTKQIRPVTIATYQMLTWRRHARDEFHHLGLFADHPWGLVVYDEVHLLPAPVFRATAAIQARRRLGLTATLVREDGKEHEVFALIGPKRFDLQWKQLEHQGYLAPARCIELRVPLAESCALRARSAGARAHFRIASENPAKQDVVGKLLARHAGDRVLVIGQYLDQLQALARIFAIPLIAGRTRNDERERLYAAFRSGEIRRLIVSKVGNFAIDLPDANVAIQVSGTFGSRQEEAQRLGRVLRKKQDGGTASFYSLVSEGTREQDFARKRQLFLTEQGYAYAIRSADDELREARCS